MSWNPVIVGVDATSTSANAARLGSVIASRAGVECLLVHAVPDFWSTDQRVPAYADATTFNQALIDASRTSILRSLKAVVPQKQLDTLEVRLGKPHSVIPEIAQQHSADLILLGGKHHSVLGRWLGGSTAQHIARTSRVPFLVTASDSPELDRILIAVDFSEAAGPTIEFGEKLARLFNADVKVMNVVEPPPLVPEYPTPYTTEELMEQAGAQFESKVLPFIKYDRTTDILRYGSVVPAIEEEVEAWNASLVVMGSHGKNWIDRVLMGSSTERILNDLPISTLIVPVQADR